MQLIEKFSESIKVLNDYRNLYHAESSSTERYKVANAINDILPEFCRLIENDAEPIVRCKDCKYLLKRNMLCLHKRNRVFNTGLNVYENHYCSYGAKMDEEQEE